MVKFILHVIVHGETQGYKKADHCMAQKEVNVAMEKHVIVKVIVKLLLGLCEAIC